MLAYGLALTLVYRSIQSAARQPAQDLCFHRPVTPYARLVVTKKITKDAIRAQAVEAGLCPMWLCRPQIPERNQQRLHQFVDESQHGTMAWMEGRQEARANPKALWPEVKTVISLGYSYAPSADIMARIGQPTLANISAYAWGRDYHDIVKKAAKRLGRWILAQARRGGY